MEGAEIVRVADHEAAHRRARRIGGDLLPASARTVALDLRHPNRAVWRSEFEANVHELVALIVHRAAARSHETGLLPSALDEGPEVVGVADDEAAHLGRLGRGGDVRPGAIAPVPLNPVGGHRVALAIEEAIRGARGLICVGEGVLAAHDHEPDLLPLSVVKRTEVVRVAHHQLGHLGRGCRGGDVRPGAIAPVPLDSGHDHGVPVLVGQGKARVGELIGDRYFGHARGGHRTHLLPLTVDEGSEVVRVAVQQPGHLGR